MLKSKGKVFIYPKGGYITIYVQASVYSNFFQPTLHNSFFQGVLGTFCEGDESSPFPLAGVLFMKGTPFPLNEMVHPIVWWCHMWFAVLQLPVQEGARVMGGRGRCGPGLAAAPNAKLPEALCLELTGYSSVSYNFNYCIYCMLLW